MKKVIAIFMAATAAAGLFSMSACGGQGGLPPAGTIGLMSTLIDPVEYAEYGIAPAALSAQTVQATVKDAQGSELKDIPIDWTAVWKNPASAWATGKQVENYLTISPSDDTLTLTVTCNEAFGEEITLRAEIRDDPEIFKELPVYFRQKYEDASADYVLQTMDDQLDWRFPEGDGVVTLKLPAVKSYAELVSTYGPDASFDNNIFSVKVKGGDTYTQPMSVTNVKIEMMMYMPAYRSIIVENGGNQEALETGRVLVVESTPGNAFMTTNFNGVGNPRVDILKLLGLENQSGLNWAKFVESLNGISGACMIIRITVTIDGKETQKNIRVRFTADPIANSASDIEFGGEPEYLEF